MLASYYKGPWSDPGGGAFPTSLIIHKCHLSGAWPCKVLSPYDNVDNWVSSVHLINYVYHVNATESLHNLLQWMVLGD